MEAKQYREGIRHHLAARKVEEEFRHWLIQPATMTLLNKLIEDCKRPNFAAAMSPPSPYFAKAVTSPSLHSPSRASLAPPLSPSPQDRDRLSVSQIQEPSSRQELRVPEEKRDLNELRQSIQKRPVIPQFYFPSGSTAAEDVERKMKLIQESFPRDSLTQAEFQDVTTKVCDLPKYLTRLLFVRIAGDKPQISRAQFTKHWKNDMEGKEVSRRIFDVLKSPNRPHIERDDFKPLMLTLMETHPGLDFLKATPEFQERYRDTVIERIFYGLDVNDDWRITFREFKRSNFVQVLQQVDQEEDINKVRDYFSYEHFYVLYCRFWELDIDHDFLIDKEDFSKYEGHSLSRKAIDRIFDQAARPFTSKVEGKMGYEDFVWFMLSEEDKTTPRAVEYWFKVIDLDNNGIVT